jgi:MFS family permease
MPFAIERLGAPQSATSLFLIVVLLSEVTGSIFWGHFADKYGNRMLLISLAVCMFFPPALAIIAPHIPYRETHLFGGVFGTINSQVLFLVLAFVFWGAIVGGHIIGYFTYMLEIAPRRRRPTFIGFTNLFGLPLIFTGLLAGYISERLGFEMAFFLAAAFSIVSIFVARTLREYRDTNHG